MVDIVLVHLTVKTSFVLPRLKRFVLGQLDLPAPVEVGLSLLLLVLSIPIIQWRYLTILRDRSKRERIISILSSSSSITVLMCSTLKPVAAIQWMMSM